MSKFELHIQLTPAFTTVVARRGWNSPGLETLNNSMGAGGLYPKPTGKPGEYKLVTAGEEAFRDGGAVTRLYNNLKQYEGSMMVEKVTKVPEAPVPAYWRT